MLEMIICIDLYPNIHTHTYIYVRTHTYMCTHTHAYVKVIGKDFPLGILR